MVGVDSLGVCLDWANGDTFGDGREKGSAVGYGGRIACLEYYQSESGVANSGERRCITILV